MSIANEVQNLFEDLVNRPSLYGSMLYSYLGLGPSTEAGPSYAEFDEDTAKLGDRDTGTVDENGNPILTDLSDTRQSVFDAQKNFVSSIGSILSLSMASGAAIAVQQAIVQEIESRLPQQ